MGLFLLLLLWELITVSIARSTLFVTCWFLSSALFLKSRRRLLMRITLLLRRVMLLLLLLTVYLIEEIAVVLQPLFRHTEAHLLVRLELRLVIVIRLLLRILLLHLLLHYNRTLLLLTLLLGFAAAGGFLPTVVHFHLVALSVLLRSSFLGRVRRHTTIVIHSVIYRQWEFSETPNAEVVAIILFVPRL